MKDEQLAKYQARLRTQTPLIGGFLRGMALRSLAWDGSPSAIKLLSETVVAHPVPGTQRKAYLYLARLATEGNDAAQQALCDLVIEYDHTDARYLTHESGYAPKLLDRRALFYFLTERWEQYENLDFDQTLLQKAYKDGSAALKLRLSDKAKAAGRDDWVRVATGGRQLKNLALLTEAEWETVLDVLARKQSWGELWVLAQNAPVAWGVQIFRRLAQSGWQPKDEEQRLQFGKFVTLADACRGAAPEAISAKADEFELNCGCLAITPTGLIATGTGDNTSGGHVIGLWDLRRGEQLSPLTGHDNRVSCLAVGQKGRLLASGSWDRSVRLWSLPDGKPLATLQGHSDWVTCLSVSPGGKLLASGSWDQTVRLWSLPGGEELRSLEGHGRWVNCLAISPSGLLASAGEEPQIHVWDLRNLSLVGLLDGHQGPVRAMAVTPDGKTLISAGDDGIVRLWSLKTASLVQTIQAHDKPIRSMALSPDGKLLATAGDDRMVKLWSMPGGLPLQELAGHTKTINAMAISPQGRLLASAGEDHKVKLWPSPVAHLTHLPIQETSLQDQTWAQQTLEMADLSRAERPWMALTLELMNWRRRFEIEIEDAVQSVHVGEFDIEIEPA